MSSDYWSRDGCWLLQACRGSCPIVAAAHWAPPCAPRPWPWPATAAVAAVAAAAAAPARRGAALHYLPPPARGQWQVCRVHRGLTGCSASLCPPYSAASPHAFPPTPCPWPARWPATCRNFPLDTWAPLLLSLTRGPMVKNPLTRKLWNDALFSRKWIPVSSGHILVFVLPSIISAHSLSSVCVMFCISSCIPVLTENLRPTQTHLTKILHKMFRFCYRHLMQFMRGLSRFCSNTFPSFYESQIAIYATQGPREYGCFSPQKVSRCKRSGT